MAKIGRKDWETRPRADWEEIQLARLREFLARQLIPFSPYYRRTLGEAGIDPRRIRSMADFRRLPFTSKGDIAPTADEPDRPRALVLTPTVERIRECWPLRRKLSLLATKLLGGADAVRTALEREYRPVSAFFTTGRSALPTLFALTNHDMALLEEVGGRILRVVRPDSPDDRLLNLFPYAPHLAFWQVYYVGLGGRIFTLNTGGGKVMGTDGILQAMTKVQPAFIAGIPGYVYHVLREAAGRGMDLSFVKGLTLGGDQVTAAYRTRVKDMLRDAGAKNPRVQSVLGFTEARRCWTECPGEAEGGFHMYPDLEIIEIVDPETGEPVPDGETGELVFTSLEGRGSCVIRYRTGDLVVGGMRWEPCPHCGRNVPRLASQLERVSNVKNFNLSKVKGTLVNLNVFQDELDSDPRIEEWQLVIRKRGDDPCDVDELHLNVALKGAIEADEHPRILEDIQARLFRATEVKTNSSRVLPLERLLELVGMETQLKAKRIVDLRASANAPTDAPAPSEQEART